MGELDWIIYIKCNESEGFSLYFETGDTAFTNI